MNTAKSAQNRSDRPPSGVGVQISHFPSARPSDQRTLPGFPGGRLGHFLSGLRSDWSGPRPSGSPALAQAVRRCHDGSCAPAAHDGRRSGASSCFATMPNQCPIQSNTTEAVSASADLFPSSRTSPSAGRIHHLKPMTRESGAEPGGDGCLSLGQGRDNRQLDSFQCSK